MTKVNKKLDNELYGQIKECLVEIPELLKRDDLSEEEVEVLGRLDLMVKFLTLKASVKMKNGYLSFMDNEIGQELEKFGFQWYPEDKKLGYFSANEERLTEKFTNYQKVMIYNLCGQILTERDIQYVGYFGEFLFYAPDASFTGNYDPNGEVFDKIFRELLEFYPSSRLAENTVDYFEFSKIVECEERIKTPAGIILTGIASYLSEMSDGEILGLNYRNVADSMSAIQKVKA
ncbi:MAG: hypothetical protein PHD02_04485 [Bacilli bacterium]|nr:hypothetical protein [Bacilli bacterium]